MNKLLLCRGLCLLSSAYLVVPIVRLILASRHLPHYALHNQLAKLAFLLTALLSFVLGATCVSFNGLVELVLTLSCLALRVKAIPMRDSRWLLMVSLLTPFLLLWLEHLAIRDAGLILCFALIPVSFIRDVLLLGRYVRIYTDELNIALVASVVEGQLLKSLAVILFSLALISGFSEWSYAAPAFLLCALGFFCLLTRCVADGKNLLFKEELFKRVRDALMRNFGADILSGMTSDAGSRGIYERLCHFFDRERPFLNPDLSEHEVAREIFTNKVYLRLAIKHYSNLNFKRFVNRYRVDYAKQLFLDNKALRVTQLCYMAGFKTKATFCTAFETETGENPKEWCDYMRTRGHKRKK